MIRLHRYLSRLQNIILSRQEIEVEAIEILDRSDRPGQTSEFYARLRFYDGSELYVVEKLIVERFNPCQGKTRNPPDRSEFTLQ